MTPYFALLFLIWGFGISSARTLKVSDEAENLPLPGATVFSQSGIILGLTDNEGVISDISDNDYPLTIRCLGFNPAICGKETETIVMTPTSFELNEIVVSPADRPIIRVLCYIREYVSGATANDTIIYYNEHMGDFFLNPRKVKGFKARKSLRLLASRLYARKADNKGNDSIFRPEFRKDDFSWESLIEFPGEEVKLAELFHDGASVNVKTGKSGVSNIRRLTPEIYSDKTDCLASFKHHTFSPWIFKLLGLTLEFNELQSTWVYRNNGSGTVSPSDILSGTYSMSVIGKGRWIKKSFHSDSPVRMYGYYEIYPVEVQYLTREEAKEIVSNAPKAKIKVSPSAPEPSPAAQRIVRHPVCGIL